jgi:hypothetical protein
MPIELTSGGIMITGDSIDLFNLLRLRSALALECKGMKLSRGPSAYAMVKKAYGLKGNKEKVLDQLNKIIEQAKADSAQKQKDKQ